MNMAAPPPMPPRTPASDAVRDEHKRRARIRNDAELVEPYDIDFAWTTYPDGTPKAKVIVPGDPGWDDLDAEPETGAIPHLASLIDWHDLMSGEYESEDWLCEPLIARARAHALYAPAKAGKSLLLLYVAAAIATGRPIFGMPAREPRRVLYIDLEMTPADLRERLAEMGYTDPDELKMLHYSSLPGLAPLDSPVGGGELLLMAQGLEVELVIIDTLSRVLSGEENSADTLRAFARCTGTPLKAAGIAVLRLDHAGKDIEKGARGTSAKNDDVDIVWQLIPRDSGRFDMRATHRRMGWVQELVSLEQTDSPLCYRLVDESWPEGTKGLADKMTELGLPVEVGRRAAEDALRAAGVGARSNRVSAAIRWRKREATPTIDLVDNYPHSHSFSSGTTPGTTSYPQGGNHYPEPCDDNALTSGNHNGNHAEPPPAGTWEPKAPPLGEPGSHPAPESSSIFDQEPDPEAF